MKWDPEAIEQYIASAEYVDTALIPLTQFRFGQEIRTSVNETALTVQVAAGIEDQLKGRIMLFPLLSYVVSEPIENVVQKMNDMAEELKQHGFQNVVFLTQNSEWTERQGGLKSDILMIQREPDMQDLSADMIQKISQKMVPMLIEIWQKG